MGLYATYLFESPLGVDMRIDFDKVAKVYYSPTRLMGLFTCYSSPAPRVKTSLFQLNSKESNTFYWEDMSGGVD